MALDETTWHRPSTQVWGRWTLHESSARRPQRAETGRAHTWGVMGDLVPGRPWTSRPQAARLSGRHSPGPGGAPCRPKPALAVERWRQAEAESAAPLLGGCDGA